MSSPHSEPRVYTLGYYGRQVDEILAFVDRLNALVLDVRARPFSSHQPDWNRDSLEFLLGTKYRHADGLGNVSNDPSKFELKDPDRWLTMIEKIVGRGKSAILLCACKFPDKCHRSEIAQRLVQRGLRVEHIEHDDVPDSFVPETAPVDIDVIDGQYVQRSDVGFIDWLESTRNADESVARITKFFSGRLWGPQPEEKIRMYEKGWFKSWQSAMASEHSFYDFIRIIDHSALSDARRKRLGVDMFNAWFDYRGIPRRPAKPKKPASSR